MRPGCWGLWAAVKLPLWLKSPSGERQWCSPFSQACCELSPHTLVLPSPRSSHQHDLVRRPLPWLTGLLQPTVLLMLGGKCTESCWPALCAWCCIISYISNQLQNYWLEGHFSTVVIINNNFLIMASVGFVPKCFSNFFKPWPYINSDWSHWCIQQT